MTYKDFIQSKLKQNIKSGFNVSESELHPLLKDFQKHCVIEALKHGRFALFEDCGLGKTFQSHEWAKHVSERTVQPVLIVAPLAVVDQHIAEGAKFGYKVVETGNEGNIQITNYEQLENTDVSIYSGVIIDESSILKNFEGAYRNLIIEKFKNTPYKLACTATPSPNDDMEICNHAEFLNVSTRTEILAMYFTHDGGETSKWRLKGHAYETFWRFVSSWSLFVSTPEDIGFDGSEYVLPPLNFFDRVIKVRGRENGKLFNDAHVNATSFNQELRITLIDRIEAAAEIVNSSNEQFLVWVNQDEEDRTACKFIPDAVSVKGHDKHDYKKAKLLGFANNEFRVLVTKKKIASMGLNYQNCHNQVFATLDFSFEQLYQAIRRSYRFGQLYPVNIYLITTDTMSNVMVSIKNKAEQFEKLKLTFKKHYERKLQVA